MMVANLLFTSLGISVANDRGPYTNCSNITFWQSFAPDKAKAAVYGFCIAFQLIVGIIVVLGCHRKCCQGVRKCCQGVKKCCQGAKKCCQGAKKCCQGAKKCCQGVRKCCQGAKKWCQGVRECCQGVKKCCQGVKKCCQGGKIQYRDFLVLILGALYLAADNFYLVNVCFTGLRCSLLAISLVLGIPTIIVRLYGKTLIERPGRTQHELMNASDMAVQRLFPMLVSTVQIDQIYTTIEGEATNRINESQDGTKCPTLYVIAGIVFFATVCATWIAAVCFVIGKHIRDIWKFKMKNPDKNINGHMCMLVFSLFILALYTPAYIALDNWWPWICVAKCYFQECSTDGGQDNYEVVRVHLLFCLCGLTIILAVVYMICECVRWCPRQGQDEEAEHLLNHSADQTKPAHLNV